MERQARHDALTGRPGRAAFEARLREALAAEPVDPAVLIWNGCWRRATLRRGWAATSSSCSWRPLRVRGRAVRVGASVGVACAPRDGATPAALMGAADEAMYREKRAGRNTGGDRVGR